MMDDQPVRVFIDDPVDQKDHKRQANLAQIQCPDAPLLFYRKNDKVTQKMQHIHADRLSDKDPVFSVRIALSKQHCKAR